MTLVILAAGMGSRYGGLKQIDPVGPNGEFIIDYSVYDAVKAGFDKVVFIIKDEIYDIFKETIGKRVENQIKVEYTFQKLSSFTEKYNIPSDRVKPLGTVQALLTCKDIVDDNFAIINADDFYGYDAYETIAKYLKETDKNSTTDCAVVGYKIENTLTENGAVKRGVCASENGHLTKLIESSCIEENGVITATPLSGDEPFVVDRGTPVSMNMFGFTPMIFKHLEELFYKFLDSNTNNMEKCEYVISEAVYDLIKENKLNVKVLDTSAKWYGVTYHEDRDMIIKEINKMVENKEYPINLWK